MQDSYVQSIGLLYCHGKLRRCKAVASRLFQWFRAWPILPTAESAERRSLSGPETRTHTTS
jgi:hypothetical protein